MAGSKLYKASTIFVSLDLSAAFATIDHTILINKLKSSFGITGTVLSWFQSYLVNRSQFVRIGTSKSSITSFEIGVPKGQFLVRFFSRYMFLLFLQLLADVVLFNNNTPVIHSFMLLHKVSLILPVFLTLNKAFLHYIPG